MNQIRRGDVFYVQRFPTYGSEQRPARPAVVISNDFCNANSDVVEVVYLTTQDKKPLPTHVEINSTGRRSIALCEQITSVDVQRLGTYRCHLTQDEMLLIDQALRASIGIATQVSQPEGGAAQYPDDDRLLALVCLRYLQQVLVADRDNKAEDGVTRMPKRGNEDGNKGKNDGRQIEPA